MANDKSRGAVFSKLNKAITLAAKDGGDPDSNFKLRILIEKAKQANMPKENILRAIKRGSGEIEGERLEEIIYEGYGPEGVGIIVEVVTENKNRTTQEIKNIFERAGGRLASPGALSFQFKTISLLTVKKEADIDGQMLKIIDLGVEDVEEAGDSLAVYVAPDLQTEIRGKIEAAGFSIVDTEQIKKPLSPVELSDEKSQKISNFIESLEDQEDVQKVFPNAVFHA